MTISTIIVRVFWVATGGKILWGICRSSVTIYGYSILIQSELGVKKNMIVIRFFR